MWTFEKTVDIDNGGKLVKTAVNRINIPSTTLKNRFSVKTYHALLSRMAEDF